MLGVRRGFTLIEIMISIALLAIGTTLALNRLSFTWLLRESDYRFALRNARHQVAWVQSTPFESLPPQQLVVGDQGFVTLAHGDLVPDSLKVSPASIAILKVDLAEGRVQLQAARGTRVVVDYRYYLPDQGEAHTVPTQAPYLVELRNQPVRRVVALRVAQDRTLTLVPPAQYQVTPRGLVLSAALAGKVVEVEYTGERVRNQLSGGFLDERLQPTPKPGPCKQILVRESYGPQGGGNIELTLVKAAPRL